MTDRDHQELARVTKTAGELSKQTFKAHCIHNKAWRLATAEADDAPITFDTLPSGRYRHRTTLRMNCFRAKAILILNK